MNIIDGIFNFFTNIGNSLAQIKEAIKSIFNLVELTIEFIPQPFLSITLIFFPILLASILYKIIRG